MLELRPNCEHCGKDLAHNSREAMICSFECTYCQTCAVDLFKDVCPSCGGNFVPRPIRPAGMHEKHPASATRIHKPKKPADYKKMTSRFKDIAPEER